MEKEKTEDITKKLKNLAIKKKTPIIVIKAGSLKNQNLTASSSSEDYYPSSNK